MPHTAAMEDEVLEQEIRENLREQGLDEDSIDETVALLERMGDPWGRW